MPTIVSSLISILLQTGLDIWVKISMGLNGVLSAIPSDEEQILHDAMAATAAKYKETSSLSEALTAGYQVFLAGEKQEFSKITLATFNLFVAGLEPTATAKPA